MIKKVAAALSELLDRWSDIGLLKMSLLSVIVLLTASACDNSCVCHYNDTLSDRLAPVKVHLYWDERFQETPTGVTVFCYGSNGCLYRGFCSNSTDYVELFLPQGEFTLLAFNQSLNELLPLWFDGYEKFENTLITATEVETPPSFMLGDDQEDAPEEPQYPRSLISETARVPFIQPVPWLALSKPQKIVIAPEELMNINTNCQCKVCCCSHLHDAASATHEVDLTLEPQVYTVLVNLNIQNITSLASVNAYLSSVRTSINLNGESLPSPAASIALESWCKRMTTQSDGVISAATTCLSMALTHQSALVIELSLVDGKTAFIETLPLKDHITVDPQTMTITAELELKEALPVVEQNIPAGGFQVTVTDWGEATDIDI